MTFNKAKSRIPTEIGHIRITLIDFVEEGETPAYQKADFEVQVLNGEDEMMEAKDGNLLPHLENSDKLWLSDFMDRMRAKAETEILP